MKKFLIAFQINSAFDMNPITSRVITSPHWPSKKELEGEEMNLGGGCDITILSICQVPMNWDNE